MKFFRMIHRGFCLAAVLAVLVSVCVAEGAFEIADEGLDLTETVSVHYPVRRHGRRVQLRCIRRRHGGQHAEHVCMDSCFRGSPGRS